MFGFDAGALTAAWTLVLGMDEGPMKVVAEGQRSNFQPFIFWAYGLACLLLLLFTAWTVMQVRGLDRRIDHLKSRFEDASAAQSQDAGVEKTAD